MSRIGLSLIISKITPMHLNLGSIQLPLNAATKTFAILAKRGAGKSYTGAVLAEEFHKHNIPFVVFDPIDVWWANPANTCVYLRVHVSRPCGIGGSPVISM